MIRLVHPILKGIHSPDVHDLKNAIIDSNASFSVLIQAMYGPADSDGEESFDLIVCNPLWIQQELSKGPLIGRHHLIVNEFNFIQIHSFLERYASSCAAPNWLGAAEKLSRIGKWEFENYIE